MARRIGDKRYQKQGGAEVSRALWNAFFCGVRNRSPFAFDCHPINGATSHALTGRIG